MKRKTTKKFVEEARKIHGNKYDYSLVDYINCRTKIKIICRKHGEFTQNPDSHLHKHGCPRCKCLKTTEEFIIDAKKVHENKYDYSISQYIGRNEKVKITCPKHGIFEQTPVSHIKNRQGCPSCAGVKRKTTEEFIEQAKKIHGNRYDYDKVKYVNSNKKVVIICKTHGEFYQTPKNHLHSHNCPKCAGFKKKTTEEFIEQAKKIHGNKYNYSKVLYIRDDRKVKIVCKEHGDFLQTPNGHLSGKGCLKCGRMSKTTEEFIQQAILIHSDRYDYSKTKYINCRTKVKIVCKQHGIFKQNPGNHLNGQNCPKCNKISVSNISQKWLDMCNVPLNCREVKIVCGRKKYIVDGYIKQTNTIYEFWGDYWHGNPQKFDANDINTISKKTFGELYKETVKKKKNLISAGYNVIDIWESNFKELKNEG